MKNPMEKFCVSALGAMLLAIFAIFMQGCSKESHNGDLDGQWQVMEVTYAGVPEQFPEDETYYYNFYLHTFQLSYTGKRSIRMTGNMTYSEGSSSLGLELGFVVAGRVDKTLIDRLVYWGMPESGEVVMDIKELTSSRLVMQHGDVVITCRKF